MSLLEATSLMRSHTRCFSMFASLPPASAPAFVKIIYCFTRCPQADAAHAIHLKLSPSLDGAVQKHSLSVRWRNNWSASLENVMSEKQQAAACTGPAWLQAHVTQVASSSPCHHTEQHKASVDTVHWKLHAGYETLFALCQSYNMNPALNLQPVWRCKPKWCTSCFLQPF